MQEYRHGNLFWLGFFLTFLPIAFSLAGLYLAEKITGQDRFSFSAIKDPPAVVVNTNDYSAHLSFDRIDMYGGALYSYETMMLPPSVHAAIRWVSLLPEFLDQQIISSRERLFLQEQERLSLEQSSSASQKAASNS